ncbi:hypothetical protein OG912_00005 [Streptomyces sp. NBC_00464]|uniref:hypothetical protein n=1 Tax=Streptomyces sp. NBC_00464 TaxID=2975751 RepID=UPI002E18CA6B
MGSFVEGLVPARLGTGFRCCWRRRGRATSATGSRSPPGPLLVASLTGNAFLVSPAALLRWAPPLVFGLYAGVLSDRLDRRRIVMTADGVRAAALVVVVALLAADRLTVVPALVALGAADHGGGVRRQRRRDAHADAGAPRRPGRGQRPHPGRVPDPEPAGRPADRRAALFAAGLVWPFLAETVLVAAGVLLVSRVVLPARTRPGTRQPGTQQPEAKRSKGVRHEVVEGLRWTVRHPAVRTLSLTILIFNVTFGAAWSVLVLYAQQRLGLGAVGFGPFTTAGALGGLLGTAMYGRLTSRVSLGNGCGPG